MLYQADTMQPTHRWPSVPADALHDHAYTMHAPPRIRWAHTTPGHHALLTTHAPCDEHSCSGSMAHASHHIITPYVASSLLGFIVMLPSQQRNSKDGACARHGSTTTTAWASLAVQEPRNRLTRLTSATNALLHISVMGLGYGALRVAVMVVQ